MDKGEIFMLTSPSNKVFFGKAMCIRANGKQHGAIGHWNMHKADAAAPNGGHCTKLNEEIRFHNFKGFDITVLCVVPTAELDSMRTYYMDKYMETTDPANLLNAQKRGGTTGPLSDATRELMSKNRQIKPGFQQPHTEETKRQISETLIGRVVRYGHLEQILPRYIKYENQKDRKGYSIISHPTIKNKSFTSKKKTLDVLLEEAVEFIRANE